MKQKELKKAAAVLIVEDGKVLAVSREDDLNDWGVPGGHVEPGETFEEAAVRELNEETGLRAYGLKLIYSGTNKDYIVKSFIPTKYYGELKSSEEGEVAWVEPQKVMEGSFSDYNTRLLKAAGLVKETK